jgi:predicted GTPase
MAAVLRAAGHRVAVLRHPMPYGDLTRQAVQRFDTFEDIDASDPTIEEREEYEPHVAEGNLLFAGIDYAAILSQAETEADVIVWDGGNNDTPFIAPDFHIVVCDPHRPGHELRYHPGETNLRMADVCVINKTDTARPEGIEAVLNSIHRANPNAKIVRAASPFHVEGDGAEIRGKRVLAVEDGPTLTHGEMSYGAAVLAAKQYGAASLVDPRPFAVGSIRETFASFPHLSELLPAMGYGRGQMEELRETIARSDAELVLIGTPIDLRRVIELDKPALRVTYRLQELGEPTLAELLVERGIIDAVPALA